jgi:hypothetical protein
MGANTFPLYNQSLALESLNQSLALESLKDQLGFLVTIILGGDSLFSQNKKTRNQCPAPGEGRRDAALHARVREPHRKKIKKIINFNSQSIQF